MFVLDEADEMLSRGFKDQIYEIFQKLSTNIQVTQCILLFSYHEALLTSVLQLCIVMCKVNCKCAYVLQF